MIAFLLIGPIRVADPTGGIRLPRDADRTIDLSALTGQTFLQAAQASGSGIFDKTDTVTTAHR